ncbi:MAG: amidotransferase [Pseudomonadales bacterium]
MDGSEAAGASPLRIGILQTDSVLETLQTRHGDYPQMFRQALAAGADAALLEFRTIDAQRGPWPDPAGCDAYLITGSRHSVYDPLPWIATLVGFVRDALAARRKVVGICFGHQLIAHFFGGETAAAPVGWCVGVHDAQVLSTEPWMDPPAARFALLSSHKDQVRRLPEGARPFARTQRCPQAGFVLGDQVLTFQGHPEFTRAYAADLLEVRAPVLGQTLHEAALASLDEPVHADMVARWILNFIRG